MQTFVHWSIWVRGKQVELGRCVIPVSCRSSCTSADICPMQPGNSRSLGASVAAKLTREELWHIASGRLWRDEEARVLNKESLGSRLKRHSGTSVVTGDPIVAATTDPRISWQVLVQSLWLVLLYNYCWIIMRRNQTLFDSKKKIVNTLTHLKFTQNTEVCNTPKISVQHFTFPFITSSLRHFSIKSRKQHKGVWECCNGAGQSDNIYSRIQLFGVIHRNHVPAEAFSLN